MKTSMYVALIMMFTNATYSQDNHTPKSCNNPLPDLCNTIDHASQPSVADSVNVYNFKNNVWYVEEAGMSNKVYFIVEKANKINSFTCNNTMSYLYSYGRGKDKVTFYSCKHFKEFLHPHSKSTIFSYTENKAMREVSKNVPHEIKQIPPTRIVINDTSILYGLNKEYCRAERAYRELRCEIDKINIELSKIKRSTN